MWHIIALLLCTDCASLPDNLRLDMEYETHEQCVVALDELLTSLELRMTFKVDESIPKQCYFEK